jgi:threonine/homoserine/homoserine lactone efflux protein
MLPPLPSLMLFLLAAFLLTLTPGPDMLFVFARSVGQGRAVGVSSALGVAVGSLLQAGLVALGLSSVLVAVPLAYEVIKDAGAIYLVYLGIRTFLSHEQALSGSSSQERRRWRVFAQGMVTNVLNPKVALFYLAFLPQFVDPTYGHVPLRLFLLGVLFNVLEIAVNVTVAVLASLLALWLKQQQKVSTILRWITGSVFLGLGVRLAFLKQR